MITIIEIYNRKTGDWTTKEFPNVDAAFEEYWKLRDQNDPDLEIELITRGGCDR